VGDARRRAARPTPFFWRLSQLCFEAEALGHVRGERKPRLFSIEDERMEVISVSTSLPSFLRWREMPEFPDPGTRRARLSRNAGRSIEAASSTTDIRAKNSFLTFRISPCP